MLIPDVPEDVVDNQQSLRWLTDVIEEHVGKTIAISEIKAKQEEERIRREEEARARVMITAIVDWLAFNCNCKEDMAKALIEAFISGGYKVEEILCELEKMDEDALEALLASVR
eukprot:SAG11_NODE_806_length_7093_cov_1.965379_3_plen_114_part_00